VSSRSLSELQFYRMPCPQLGDQVLRDIPTWHTCEVAKLPSSSLQSLEKEDGHALVLCAAVLSRGFLEVRRCGERWS
jgi:hypothetical protein